MSTQTIGTIAARLDRLPISGWHLKTLFLLGFGLICDTLDLYFGGAILAALIAQGWSNNVMNGYFISGTMIGFLIGAIIAGWVGDRLGRRKVMCLNLFIIGASSFAAAFATNIWMLIVFRSFMGIGLGSTLAASYGSFGEYLPPQCRGKYSSYLSLLANFGPPVATVIAMAVIPRFGWQVLFLGVGVLSCFTLVMQWKYLSESPRWLASKGFFEKADEIVSQAEKSLEMRKGIKLPPIERIEATAESPKQMPFTALLKGALLRRTIAVAAGLIGMNVALYTIVNWIPTIFVSAGLNVTKSLAMTAVILIGAPVGVFLCSAIIDRVPRKSAMVTLLIGMSIVGYIYSLQRDENLIMGLGFILITILYFYTAISSTVYVGESFPTEARLRGVGFANVIGRIVAIITPPAVAWILTHYGATGVFGAVSAVLILVAIIIAIAGVETRQKSLEDINKLC